MREVHPIPVAMVQPWMIWNVAAELVLLSLGVPATAYLFVKSVWIVALIPVCLIVSYRITAKDLYRLKVLTESANRPARPRSTKFWNGAKTYVPC